MTLLSQNNSFQVTSDHHTQWFAICIPIKYLQEVFSMFDNELWTKEDVINRISQLRTRKNLSARKLSLGIDKNPAYIVRLESKNDSFDPSISTLLEIIHACESSVHEFFYYDLNAYKKDKEIIELLKGATDEQKRGIIALLKK